jgi:hypothetical protein
MLNTPLKDKANVVSYRTKAVSEPREVEVQLQTTIEKITPEMAQKWLETNDPQNRKISTSNVKKYAADIAAGRWEVTGESIKFDDNGMLLDGQHRLLACMDAGKPFYALVVRGLPEATKSHMDLGMKRTAGMILHRLGHSYTTQLGGAALNLLAIKAQGRDVRGRHSVPEVVELAKRHPDLEVAITEVYSKGKLVAGPTPSILGAVYYAAAYLLNQKERADEFLEVFRTGIPAYEGDPAQLWRERLIRERGKGLSINRAQQLRGTCHAWNLFSQGIGQSKFRIPDETHIEGLDVTRI